MRAGGGFDGQQLRQMPSPVTIIIWINVAVFILQYFFGLLWEEVRDPESHQLVALQMGAVSREVLAEGKVHRLITYMFVHGNVLHILGNMFLVYFAGKHVLKILGTKHFLGVYFLGGVLGALGQLVISGPNDPLIGASAGAFALVCAFATLMPELELLMLLYFVIPIRLRAKYLALGLVGVSVIWFLVASIFGAGTHIAHLAHIVGALAGWYYVRVLGYGGGPVKLSELRRMRAEREARERVHTKRQRWSKKFGKGKVVNAKILTKEEDDLSDEVDRVLDKINREGFQSLTKDERRILEDGSEHIGKGANRR